MSRLEDLRENARVCGLVPKGVVTIQQRLVFRDDEPNLEVVTTGRPWSFDADGHLLRLVSEAWRIRLAWLFDPYLALSTSRVEPLPHQISAVYGEMLNRHPLRFLLADDPGAGKTIMAGLLIKELMLRGDVERCLIVARVDQLSRNKDLQERLESACDWDLVIVDEAHKMAAHYFGSELKFTGRYRLGQLLSRKARHFLLMTATPHNGNDEDFQLFLPLLDGDRFEGRYRSGVHVTDPSDMMRRLVKEDLVRFDGTPLFPERIAATVEYELSDLEKQLYTEVTDYVRDEMNRVDRIADSDG